MRTRSNVCLVLLSAILLVSATPARVQGSTPATAGSGAPNYYIALGDSLAYGVTAPGIQPDPKCASPTAPGYVCIVYGYVHDGDPAVQLVNYSAPDVDSCVLVNGFGPASPCLHAPGLVPLASPLAAAVSFISSHQGHVGLVTLDIGGADLIPLLPAALSDPAGTAAKLPGLVEAFQSNLDIALARLRSALGPSPDQRLVVITQYNPLGGIASPPLPPGLPDIARGAINSLNVIMKTEAMRYGATVADVAGAFDANPGGAALLTFVPTSLASGDPSQIDIYPTLDGYRLYGDTVLKSGGYSAPNKLTARLSRRVIRRRKWEKLKGVAISGAILKVRISRPRTRSLTTSLFADDTGRYAVSFRAGKRAGKGLARVCATDEVTGRRKCVKVKFTVR